MTHLEQILSQEISTAPETLVEDEDQIKFVIFKLGQQYYAFKGNNIGEILPPGTTIFFVPGCPPTLPGVINLRGEIASVIDIALFLQLIKTPAKESQSLLMCKARGNDDKEMRSAIAVNQVIDVLDIATTQIRNAPDNLSESIQPYVLGMLAYQDHTVTWLDLEQIFKSYLQGLQSE